MLGTKLKWRGSTATFAIYVRSLGLQKIRYRPGGRAFWCDGDTITAAAVWQVTTWQNTGNVLLDHFYYWTRMCG